MSRSDTTPTQSSPLQGETHKKRADEGRYAPRDFYVPTTGALGELCSNFRKMDSGFLVNRVHQCLTGTLFILVAATSPFLNKRSVGIPR
ncbi:hypothetical protein, partial [Providencia sp. NPDC089923]|uniref:hypothetical protein n=1 Tax=Providencia sp. NPDC089923 TaxID=3415004 RepID=UPI003C2BC1A3